MNLGSLILGIVSLICMVAGIVFSFVPYVGAIVSFLGPVLGLAGIITGGVAMSRAKNESGETDGLAIAGLVISAVGFILSLLVALTCGMCNACASSSMQNGGRVNGQTPFWMEDAGLSTPIPRPNPVDPSGAPIDPNAGGPSDPGTATGPGPGNPNPAAAGEPTGGKIE